MPSSSADPELLPLSWLSQYGYCPRRCALLALERVWAENEFTAAGRAQHQKVHTARVEHRGENISLFELPVFSRTLGVSGLCDCVEAIQSPDGVHLPYGDGRYRLYPVEYKHGVVRDEAEYHMQLCAQAMCLEEQFGGTISAGAIFFIDAHRRDEVTLTPELRKATADTAKAVALLVTRQLLPQAKYSAKCKKCSLQDECAPKLKHSAAAYCQTLWNTILEENFL